MHNKADCFEIKKIKGKNIRYFKQRYSMESKGLEINQAMSTFLQNQDFFLICPSSLAPDSYTIGQVVQFSSVYLATRHYEI